MWYLRQVSAAQVGTPFGHGETNISQERAAEATELVCPGALPEASQTREEWCHHCSCPKEKCREDHANGACRHPVLHPHRQPRLPVATSAADSIIPCMGTAQGCPGSRTASTCLCQSPTRSGCQPQLPSAFWRQPLFPSAVTGFGAAAQNRHLVLKHKDRIPFTLFHATDLLMQPCP